MATRLLLVLCESGFIPAGLYTITRFYERKETSKRFSWFLMVTYAFSSIWHPREWVVDGSECGERKRALCRLSHLYHVGQYFGHHWQAAFSREETCRVTLSAGLQSWR